MQRFTVNAIGAEFRPGSCLLLTPEQAAPRMDRLKKQSKNTYLVVKPVEFRVGEVLGAEGSFDALPFQDLILMEEPAPPSGGAQ